MRTIDLLVIHESDTPTGRKTTVEDIDSWHIDRGFVRGNTHRRNFNNTLKAIGYHFVVYIDGTIHTGRHVDEVGAHCSGLNAHSIGICMVGRGIYTVAQWAGLKNLIEMLLITYPGTQIVGHCDTKSGKAQGKTCPGFDVHSWIGNDCIAPESHVA